ncbi:MAG: transglutaminase domain-containing protein, partial [Saprospiraceae bacterium]|nr:transglutaminase domain-containing protein [Saprospiraceae bacterium]
MKSHPLILLLLFALSACSTSKKVTYNNSPVIQAKSDYTEYRIGDDWYRGRWSIAPQVEHDTLTVVCYQPTESFKFRTDMDSIEFDIEVNTSTSFYVKMDESTYAHTIIQGIPFQTKQLEFDKNRNSEINIKYQTETSAYLDDLKAAYPLDFITDAMSDSEVVLAVLDWTNSRWNHNGNNSPSKNDAITILNEADEGLEFPCFAYAIVLRDQLSALGYKARTVYLKTHDAENRKSPPGHVATEVYLDDLQKWVFIDGQFNVMPTLNSIPLNGVEFQDAIGGSYDQFVLQSVSNEVIDKKNYVDFVYDYLFYFDTSLDNRYEQDERHFIDGKRSMMLVPNGAKELQHIDFWNMDVDYCVYTNSLKDF